MTSVVVPDRAEALRVGKAILEAHGQWETENAMMGGQVAWDEPHVILLGQAAMLAALRRPAPTVEEVRDAIHAWIREDAGLNVKMALFPNVVSKLVLRLHALWTGEKG
jgi:hypothetical protein